VYQELLHVPFIVHAAGKVPAMRVENAVSTVDLSPTVLDLLGVDPLPYFEGKSLTGYMKGAPPAGPAVAFSDFLDDRRVIRAGRWKVILRGVNIAFFDLESDPWEQKELSRASHPIAFRYARMLQGQFLGAKDLSRWLDPTALEKRMRFDAEEAQMDDTIKAQLKALGYAN
jgi:arylsulfatase A-like enzyme